MKELKTEIIIRAPRSGVWQVLTDFNRYAEWNPFITSSQGKAVVGTQLTNQMQSGDKTFTFKPKLTQVDPEQYLEWLGHLAIPGLFDGRHYFRLEAIEPELTQLTQGERFSGILSGLILKRIAEDTRHGFIAMNRALQQRAEAMQTTTVSSSRR